MRAINGVVGELIYIFQRPRAFVCWRGRYSQQGMEEKGGSSAIPFVVLFVMLIFIGHAAQTNAQKWVFNPITNLFSGETDDPKENRRCEKCYKKCDLQCPSPPHGPFPFFCFEACLRNCMDQQLSDITLVLFLGLLLILF